MGHSAEKRFELRFEKGIEVAYCSKSLDGEERQLNQKRLSDATKAVMAAVLKREPTQAELLGLVPIVVSKKKAKP